MWSYDHFDLVFDVILFKFHIYMQSCRIHFFMKPVMLTQNCNLVHVCVFARNRSCLVRYHIRRTRTPMPFSDSVIAKIIRMMKLFF